MGTSISEIAKKEKCHLATVYSELKRNQMYWDYCPQNAHVFSVRKRKATRKYRIPDERIYRYVAKDKRQSGKLYRDLRQRHKRYRKSLKEKLQQ